LPNVGPYIYDVSISGFTRSSIYIYEISSLRVNANSEFLHVFLKLILHHVVMNTFSYFGAVKFQLFLHECRN